MKTVLFSLNASRTHTNLAIRCLQTSLERAGFSVVLLERTEKDKRAEVLEALYREKADLYGFSTYLWNREEHLALAEDLKRLLPRCRIVFGGPEVSYEDASFLTRYPFVDTLLRGEGEETLVSLCRLLLTGQPLPPVMDGGPYRDFVHESIHYKKDENFAQNILYYESSRGCPYRCAYCLSSLHTTPAVRAKSVEKTLEDLRAFEAFREIKVIKFIDRTFNFDRKRAIALWTALLGEEYTKHYHFEVCASLLDEEAFALLARFPQGKIQLEVGVQTTNPAVLEAVGRKDDPALVVSAVERLYRLGNMHIHADLIAGLPGEDLTSFARSFDRLYGKCHMLQLGFLKILKETPMEQIALDRGYRVSARPPYELLSSDEMSFEDILLLKRVESVLERFGNSGRFSRGMACIMEHGSPFAKLRKLSDFFPRPELISQRNAYEGLFAWGRTLPDVKEDALKQALALDFLLNEQGHLPAALAWPHRTWESGKKRVFGQKHPDAFLPATEIYRIGVRSLAVDRKNGRFYELGEDA